MQLHKVPMHPQVSVETTVVSDSQEACGVAEFLMGKLEEAGLPATNIFGMRLAIEEAMANAIKHGSWDNKPVTPDTHARKIIVHMSAGKISPIVVERNRDIGDESQHIHKECDHLLRFSVKDHGQGFVRSEVPDPTDDDNLEVPSGRGLALMESFCDEVTYLEGGTKIVLCIAFTREEADSTLRMNGTAS